MISFFKPIRHFLHAIKQGRALPRPITEQSSLQEICALYPNAIHNFEKRFRVKLSGSHVTKSLGALVSEFSLPPAQIVYMEIQLAEAESRVIELSAEKAKRLIEQEPQVSIIDVREAWEREICNLPNSRPFDETLWGELQTQDPKKPLLLFCHFGIRSKDAANYLAQQGFTAVYHLKGGIDAWSNEVDPTVAKYESGWC